MEGNSTQKTVKQKETNQPEDTAQKKAQEEDVSENDLSQKELPQTEISKGKTLGKKRVKKHRARKFPIPLRIFVVLILFIICLLLGLIVGYSVLGDGQLSDALNIETYQHIFDIIKKE